MQVNSIVVILLSPDIGITIRYTENASYFDTNPIYELEPIFHYNQSSIRSK